MKKPPNTAVTNHVKILNACVASYVAGFKPSYLSSQSIPTIEVDIVPRSNPTYHLSCNVMPLLSTGLLFICEIRSSKLTSCSAAGEGGRLHECGADRPSAATQGWASFSRCNRKQNEVAHGSKRWIVLHTDSHSRINLALNATEGNNTFGQVFSAWRVCPTRPAS